MLTWFDGYWNTATFGSVLSLSWQRLNSGHSTSTMDYARTYATTHCDIDRSGFRRYYVYSTTIGYQPCIIHVNMHCAVCNRSMRLQSFSRHNSNRFYSLYNCMPVFCGVINFIDTITMGTYVYAMDHCSFRYFIDTITMGIWCSFRKQVQTRLERSSPIRLGTYV